ncbi:MAG: OB-fold domain-containing protein [Alphaproteobacteria bacterium]|nr:DNA-binding protein [Rhodospirillaceae bacterium]MDP6407576.1 OB-fold domain-containing protein [Alphaproteobacteria bacterium]MDP6622931.1 OB-fold domain-containing protein [Alphaproteobacteria bacterium]|tara:strand:+ start:444 stop:869 length:426 start_codon:yes stop_codon:yes gene_type:complete
MPDQKTQRMLPKIGLFVDTEPFWKGTERGELMLQYCPDTQQFQMFPRPVSMYSGRRELEWRKVSGRGTIYACTIVRVPAPNLDASRLPLSVVTVELEEGVRILGNVLDRDPESVAIGQRVELAWDPISDDVQYPAFVVVED